MTTSLQKFTVPQLKALCKEKGLTGYSKLAKPALIEKLAAAGGSVVPTGPAVPATSALPEQPAKHNDTKKNTPRPTLAPPATHSTTSASKDPPELPTTHGKKKSPKPPPVPATTASDCARPVAPSHTLEEQMAVGSGKEKATKSVPAAQRAVDGSRSTEPEPRRKSTQNQPDFASSSLQTSSTIRPSGDGADRPRAQSPLPPQVAREADEPPAKKQKLSHIPGKETIPVHQKTVSQMEVRSNAILRPIPVIIQPKQPVNKEKSQVETHSTQAFRTTGATGKRYIPLVIKPKTNAVPPAVAVQQQATSTSFLHHKLSPNQNNLFSFPPPTPEEESKHLTPKAITLPPPLSQRKYATNLAIILRDISFEDLLNIALASKLLRYSSYLSAVNYLRRWFFGERLNKVLGMKGISVDRMSLWEYRRVREREVEERKRVLSDADGRILGKLVGADAGVVEEGLWSRDDTRGLVVALRFLLTKCYFLVSLNRDLEEVKKGRVVDVQEVVKDEIWCVTVERRDTSKEATRYYVLEDTCEVIGSPAELGGTLPTRTDWSVYIQKHISNHGPGAAQMMGSIMSHVRWTNGEEYDCGISKLWLKKTWEEGEVGELKRSVARKYVLACTMANSLSGRYMTSNEMEQELNGLPVPSKVGSVQKVGHREGRMNLFVPAHHHVESVHFTTASKKRLHSALAVVQTPSREYFILKENGMQVGCEEEGVAEVWMEIIGCCGMGGVTEIGSFDGVIGSVPKLL